MARVERQKVTATRSSAMLDCQQGYPGYGTRPDV